MSLNKLTKARMYCTDKEGSGQTGPGVNCYFNPHEYTITKTNTFGEDPENSSTVPKVYLKKMGPQNLKLKLIFDGYESGKDVGDEMHKMWELMNPKHSPEYKEHKDKKVPPPYVAFEWGPFKFIAVIKTMSQKFLLFKPNGTPVRAEVTVTLTQYLDNYKYGAQNPTSGGGPTEQVWRVKQGDRIDLIAAHTYGDATRWPQIASYNDISNPHLLRTGMILNIPALD